MSRYQRAYMYSCLHHQCHHQQINKSYLETVENLTKEGLVKSSSVIFLRAGLLVPIQFKLSDLETDSENLSIRGLDSGAVDCDLGQKLLMYPIWLQLQHLTAFFLASPCTWRGEIRVFGFSFSDFFKSIFARERAIFSKSEIRQFQYNCRFRSKFIKLGRTEIRYF